LSSVYSALRESVASHGWGNGALYAFGRALFRATRGRCRLFKYYFVAQPVPAQPLGAAGAAKTRIREVAANDHVVAGFPRPPEVIARRFAGGAVCLAAERDRDLMGFIWLKLDRYEEDEVRCDYLLDPAGGVAWDFDAWVAPKFRMTRAFVQLWDAANDYLRQRGYRWSASRISAFNPVSLASHRRLGAIDLSTGLFLVLGSMQLALFTCRPYFHLSRSAASRPQLMFRTPERRNQAGGA
jgi:hypothetical protein